MKSLDFKCGGKAAFRRLFDVMIPNNEILCALAYSAAISAVYGKIISSLYGQHPIIVLASQEKGLGKTSLLKQCLWAVPDPKMIYNNTTSNEYILAESSQSTLLIGLEDTTSMTKEEKLLVGVFEDAQYGT